TGLPQRSLGIYGLRLGLADMRYHGLDEPVADFAGVGLSRVRSSFDLLRLRLERRRLRFDPRRLSFDALDLVLERRLGVEPRRNIVWLRRGRGLFDRNQERRYFERRRRDGLGRRGSDVFRG